LNYVYCVEGPSVFYNEKGANTTNTEGSDIYIDCQPVSTSEETTTQQSSSSSNSFAFFKNSQLKYSFFILLN
jgi:phage gp45-like